MPNTEASLGIPLQQSLIAICLGALFAVGACCLLLLFCAGLVLSGAIPASSMTRLCMMFVALCALFGGRFAVKKGEGAPILLGSGCGFLFCLFLIGVACLGYGQAFEQGSSIWILFAALLGGGLSGLSKPAHRSKTRKRKKH